MVIESILTAAYIPDADAYSHTAIAVMNDTPFVIETGITTSGIQARAIALAAASATN